MKRNTVWSGFPNIEKFETMFTKHIPFKILNLNFEKTVYLTAIFQFNGPPLLHQKEYNDVIYSWALECIVWTQLIS